MTLHRFAVRRDRNEAEIVQALEQVDAMVTRLNKPLDLLVGFRGQLFLIEVKDGAKTAGNRPLTPDQEDFLAECQRRGLPACVVTDVHEALAAIGAVR